MDTSKDDSDKSSVAASDSDSDSDSSDDGDLTTIFYGQHWSDNPSGHLLPKLDSPALVLTFRPSKQQDHAQALTNGNPGIHATRHNPHAHSHELPSGQHLLFVLTAKHQMYEFNVLAGKLSDWSRRNPSSVLPEEFKLIRDRVMGAIWDISGSRERLWLYGGSFVCMLNVGVNLELDPAARSHKRRRKPKTEDAGEDADEIRKRRKLESGAGGKMNPAFVNGAFESAKKYENGKAMEVSLAPRVKEESRSDDDEADDEVDFTLRRVKSEDGEDERDSGTVAAANEHGCPRDRRWWCTFKYRPILGVVPLEGGHGEQQEGGEDSAPEVVLVERPAWDVQNEKEKK